MIEKRQDRAEPTSLEQRISITVTIPITTVNELFEILILGCHCS